MTDVLDMKPITPNPLVVSSSPAHVVFGVSMPKTTRADYFFLLTIGNALPPSGRAR